VKWVESTDDQRRAKPRAEYDGFISYSHAVDRRLAPALQSGLQRFAKPWYRLRSLRIFRDDASLAANPALWSAIEDALSRSRWFVLLASPTAASSRWVAREAEYWLAHRSIDHLLVVLSEGDLAWDEALRRFNPSRTNALPQPLLTAFEEEPRWMSAGPRVAMT
jgi:TIR domain